MRAIDIIMAKALGKGAKGAILGWPAMLGVAGGGEIDPPPEGYIYLADELGRILKDESNALIIELKEE